MKTATAAKMWKAKSLHVVQRPFTTLLLAITAAVGIPAAYAGQVNPTYDLTLTENSSTSLTLTYTGPGGSSAFSVLNTSPDKWTIQVLSNTITLSDVEFNFQEPENPNEVNDVLHDSTISKDIFVTSDSTVLLDSPTAVPPIPGVIGTDNGALIFLFFNDLAGPAEAVTGVPETGATLGLMALSLTALLGLARFRSARPA
jgi:hypothetical protein